MVPQLLAMKNNDKKICIHTHTWIYWGMYIFTHSFFTNISSSNRSWKIILFFSLLGLEYYLSCWCITYPKLCHPLEKLKDHLFSWHLSHFYNPVSASFFRFVCPTSSHKLPSPRQTAFTHCSSIKLIDSQSVDLIPTLLNGYSLETLKFKTYLKTLFLLSPFTDFPMLKESLIFIILIYTNAFLSLAVWHFSYYYFEPLIILILLSCFCCCICFGYCF